MKKLRAAIVFVVFATFVIMSLLAVEQALIGVSRWISTLDFAFAAGPLFFACISAACAYLVWSELQQMRRGEMYHAMYHPNGRNLGVPRT